MTPKLGPPSSPLIYVANAQNFRNFSVIKYLYSLLGGGGIIMGPVAQPARRRGSGLAAVPWPHSYMNENFYNDVNIVKYV